MLFTGTGSDNSISTLGGDDEVHAGAGNDAITGGAGADTLRGESGDDIYHYHPGDGDDTIIDQVGQGAADRMRLHGIDASRATFESYANTDDITLWIAESSAGAGDGGRIDIVNTFNTQNDGGIEFYEFDDGTVYDKSDVASMALSPAVDETISGQNSAESFNAGRGNDIITGNRGNDVFIYRRGDGNDRFNEYNFHDWDRVVLHEIDPSEVTLQRNGNNVTLVIAESAPGAGDGGEIYLYGGGDSYGSLTNYRESGFERIDFDDGTQWTPATLRSMVLEQVSTDGDDSISGFINGDTHTGGLGNDTISGNRGNDVYVYNRGDGNDTINEYNFQDWDRLVLHGIDPSQVTLQRNGNNVTLVISESSPGAGDGGQIYLNGGGGSYGSLTNYRESGLSALTLTMAHNGRLQPCARWCWSKYQPMAMILLLVS